VYIEDEAVEDLLTQLEQKLTEGDQNLCKQRPRTSANEACKNLRARKETAIYWTVRCEDHDLLKRFLRIPTLDANLGSHRDGDNDTELHWAARLGNVSVLSVLLEARCDSGYLEMRNKVKETALYDGIRAQSVEVVQILLEKGAKVMISNIASFSPLHLAAKRKKPAIAQLIWEHIVDKEDQQSSLTAFTDEGKTALHHAARDGHKDTVELLLKVGAEPNVISHSGKRPLHSAALRGNTKIMDLLWRAGAATNTTTNNGYTVLHCAAEQGHHEAIQIMLKTWTQSPAGNDSEPRPAEGEALSKDAVADAPAQGVNQGTPQSQKRVVSGGMPLTQEILACTLADGSTALHLAVSSSKKRGSSKVVGLFLDKLDEGIVAAQTKQGETILHLMARMRRDDLLDTLTKIPQIGKILEVQSNDGSTALHRAIEDGSSKLQERLINCMSDTAICFQNHDEETALHLAARKKRPYALKKLLLKMNPAAIAARNHYGETALHVAAAIGDVDVTRRLLDRMSPGDIALVDVKGQNAFTKAALTRNPESGIIELMVKHEADVPVEYETAWAPMDQQARMSVNRVLTEVLDNISWADYSSHTSWQMIVRWASRNGHIETVKRVLDAVPLNFVEEIDRQEHTKAERRGSTTVKGEQMPSAPKESALFWAALGGHDDIVNLLLKHPSLEAYYQRSERSLNRCLRAAQAAARNGHFSIVTVLIQHMQPRNGVDTQGWKPLDWAVAFGDPDIVRLMLIKGAGPLASSQRPTKSQEIDKILSSPQPTPRWYSRENPLSVWSSKPQLKLAPFEAACKRFNACVVDFYHHEGGMYPLEMNGRSIYDVIYNPDLGPNKIMEDARQSVEDHPAMHNPHSFRWIHLPANNVSSIHSYYSWGNLLSKSLPVEMDSGTSTPRRCGRKHFVDRQRIS
jgi:ankyrin repeat protein